MVNWLQLARHYSGIEECYWKMRCPWKQWSDKPWASPTGFERLRSKHFTICRKAPKRANYPALKKHLSWWSGKGFDQTGPGVGRPATTRPKQPNCSIFLTIVYAIRLKNLIWSKLAALNNQANFTPTLQFSSSVILLQATPPVLFFNFPSKPITWDFCKGQEVTSSMPLSLTSTACASTNKRVEIPWK